MTSPELTCRVLAPSARISAEERRASSTVAHVVKRAFSTASATSMTVMIASICSSRLTTGSDSPPAVSADEPDSLASAKAWKASTATMPVTVTAMFAALSSARRGRRATSRSPNSAGIGSRLEIRMSSAPTLRRAGDVVQRGDGAAARGADRGDERRRERHRDRQADDLRHGARRERGRARGADEGRTGLGEERRDQPSGHEADHRGEQREHEVLGEEGRRDHARRAADGLQEADPARVLRQPTPDEDGHARDREQRKQQRPRLEHPVPVLDQRSHLPPRSLPRSRTRAGLDVEVAVVGERLGVVGVA